MKEQPLDYESRTDRDPPWRNLWPPSAAAMVVVGVVLLMLVSVLVPALNRSSADNPMHGNAGKCRNNLRQIGMVIEMYAYNNHGRLPPDLATVLVAEDLRSDVFICPSANDSRATGPTTQALFQDFAKPGHCSYTLASPLPPTWNALTPAHVLAYETPGNHPGQGTNVLFGDGRCEFLPDAKAACLIAELKAGYNPPRKP